MAILRSSVQQRPPRPRRTASAPLLHRDWPAPSPRNPTIFLSVDNLQLLDREGLKLPLIQNTLLVIDKHTNPLTQTHPPSRDTVTLFCLCVCVRACTCVFFTVIFLSFTESCKLPSLLLSLFHHPSPHTIRIAHVWLCVCARAISLMV